MVRGFLVLLGAAAVGGGCHREATVGGGSAAPAAAVPAAPVTAAKSPAAGVGVDLARVVVLARACVTRPPHSGKGPDGVALDMMPIGLGQDPRKGPSWGVTFQQDEHPPRSAIHVVIDPVAGTCDGAPVVATQTLTSKWADVDALIAGARRCAEGPSWGGAGVGRSPLLWDQAELGYRPFDSAVVVSFPETTPAGAPSGLELSITLDGTQCGAVPMD